MKDFIYYLVVIRKIVFEESLNILLGITSNIICDTLWNVQDIYIHFKLFRIYIAW